MQKNNLITYIRISLKLIFAWIIIIFVFFLNFLEVNLSCENKREFQADKIIYDKWCKIITSWNIKKKDTKKKVIEKQKLNIEFKKSKITEEEKYQFLLNILKQAFSNNHWSWIDKDSFNKLCLYYKTYCNIVDIDNNFNYQEKIYYAWITIYLLKFIDSIFYNIKDKLYYIKIQKDNLWRRWYAWHHSIVINIKDNLSYDEFYEVLSHELWHIVDLWILQGDHNKKSSVFKEYGEENFAINDHSLIFYKLSFLSSNVKRPSIYVKDFVSWYALTDVFEDFAESFNMFLNHNYVFKQMAKESNILQKKYLFLNIILKWKYLKSDKNFNYKYGFRPWDSTKMK